jgi:copper chaperone CopZ
MSNTIVLKVAMMCGGCSGAVERVLSKMEGASRARVSRAVPSTPAAD